MAKLSKKRIFRKVVATTFIIIILQSTLLPYYSYALTTGPHQPEYTSYEEPGATDLVNLVTGDFTFSIPILDVPAPGGNFSVPLTYNAGIGTEQEASWVGLGWTLNVGAITRQYTGFPDDAGGETQEISVKDLTGVRGWTSSILGLGNIGWNSQVGHYGQLSIGLGWDESGVTVDPISFGLTLLSVATIASAYASVAQAAKEGATALKTAKAALSQTLTSEAIGQGMSMVATAITAGQTPAAPSSGYWKYKKRTEQRFLHKNYWIWLDMTRQEDMYGALYLQNAKTISFTNNDNFVDLNLKVNNTTTTLEQFNNANYQGSASDINFYMKDGQSYEDAKSAATLALDDYSVKAPGVSGAIQPYRLDIGSVSMPRQMTAKHQRLAPIKYQNYKVPFIYKGAASNKYYHHVGAASSITIPSFYDNALTASQSNSNPDNNTMQTLNFNDVIFGSSNRIQNGDVNNTKKVAQGNDIVWHTNNEIKNQAGGFQSGFIDYFTGSARSSFRQNTILGAVKTCYASSNSFTDGVITLTSANDLVYFPVNTTVTLELDIYSGITSTEEGSPAGRQGPGEGGSAPTHVTTTATITSVNAQQNSFTVNTSNFASSVNGKSVDIQVTSGIPPKSPDAIGGFCITGSDGMVYHFSLPVYDYNSKTRIEDKADVNKNTVIKRLDPFANTWLLTAITGSDFVDRSSTGSPNGILDEYDWGHWVKFSYGKYSDNYKWRIPFADNTFTIDAENSSKMYSEGLRQLYYLNCIETRSHVALFFKDVRNDNKDATVGSSVSTLKLTEISLMTKEAYKKLIADYAFPDVRGVLDLNLMTSAISATAGTQNFLYNNALKRIKFNHSYNLAQGTPNSSSGKLTLDRVSIVGKSDMKIMPDYLFMYSNNFNYATNKWDGWGMYTPDGDATNSTHKASELNSHGAAWSLTKITTPSGSEIQVDYERDSYASVSGIPVTATHVFGGDYSIPPGTNVNYIDVKATNTSLKVGDQVRVIGTLKPCGSGGTAFDVARSVQSISSKRITLNGTIVTGGCSFPSSINGTVEQISPTRKGGDLRVKMLTTKDGSIQRKTRYIYSDDETPTGLTSGVVAQEPDYINNDLATQPINVNVPGFPVTPVMYKKVSVLTGNLTSDADYHTKEVYEFETPDENVLTITQDNPNTRTLVAHFTAGFFQWHDYLTRVHNKISDYSSRIGNLKSVKVYDKEGILQASTVMTYTQSVSDPQYLGVYSEGTLMADRVSDVGYKRVHKMMRTTVLKYPNLLKSVVTTKDGLISKTENLKWDMYSTQVLEKSTTSPGGFITKYVTVPAYIKYPELGPKGLDPSNRNMIEQEAAQYLYRIDGNGNTTGLISASATIWKKDWNNYRIYNTTTGFYENSTEGPNVWRKSAGYMWTGDITRLQADGTSSFTSADEFNFTFGASNSKWRFLGEAKQYNHFSSPVESRDVNDIYSSIKFGYDNQFVIAQAINAKYGEIAFSSAEDKIDVTPVFFGGEVALGDGVVQRLSKGETSDVHTGDAIVKLGVSGKSFIFKSKAIATNKFYRATVWTNSVNGRIYLKINGVDQPLSPSPQSSKKIGNWYRLDYEFKTPTSTITSFEVGVTSTNGDVLFDDFRFQPSDATMTCYVYDPLDFFFSPSATTFMTSEYVLDNNNLFTKYEYNHLGRLSKTYVESMRLKSVKLVSESKVDYKRFHTNQ
ncbi:MAG: hypothetical protein JNJ75_03570 [Cyclobacteriaceae bacterium]|nr:hypothetical protein [Cyclobacteriaceae bacterium]